MDKLKEVKTSGASLTFEGDKRLLEVFRRLSDPAQRRELMWNISTVGVSSTQQRFMDEVAPDGTRWTQSRRAKEFGGKTLRASNLLFQSIHAEATETEAQWGSNMEYAGVHQFGAVIRPKTKKALRFSLAGGKFVTVKKVTIPARPFLGLNDLDKRRIGETTEIWFKKKVRP